jgi:hypothetical protein
MIKRIFVSFPAPAVLAAALATLCAACSSSTTQPSGGGTASVTTPAAVLPSASAQIKNADQPVTLVVQNAVVTQSSGTTYLFEVATDPAFANKVQTKDNVAESTSGQTSVKLDALAANKDYYWHARATGGGTAGPFSTPAKFTIGPAVVISAPSPISPLTGAVTGVRPTLRVTNATRTGPAGAITYKFDVSNSSTFTNTVVSVTVAEGVNETGYILTSDLAVGTTFYWRATAIDAANGVQSTASPIQSFTTARSQAETLAAQIGITLWPGTAPTGSTGHATMGEPGPYGAGWQPQTLYYAPGNVFFPSPDAEMLRLFDLLDRGYDPESAIAWMNGNGYPTAALWYPPPEKAVIGLRYVYLAARNKVVSNATWDIVVRVE